MNQNELNCLRERNQPQIKYDSGKLHYNLGKQPQGELQGSAFQKNRLGGRHCSNSIAQESPAASEPDEPK